MPLWLSVPLVAVLASAPAPQAVEIDRTLQHVYNTAIMASDVRQAKQLKLVADVSSDERILTALENRLLLLREVSRVASPSPATTAAATTAVIATRRQEWTASWPPGTDVPGLLRTNGMTDQALDGWFRDDFRIAAYVELRFGATADDARAARLAEWVTELRRRANLSGR